MSEASNLWQFTTGQYLILMYQSRTNNMTILLTDPVKKVDASSIIISPDPLLEGLPYQLVASFLICFAVTDITDCIITQGNDK